MTDAGTHLPTASASPNR